MSEARRRKQQERKKRKHPLGAEEIAVFIAGVIAVLVEVLPAVTFWWRLGISVVFACLAIDLCLRSHRVKDHVASQAGRLVLSLVVLAGIICILWNPMRRQYAQEHLPPSLIYLMGSPVGEDTSPEWLMALHHYGPSPAYACTVDFLDLQQNGPETPWHATHWSPPQLRLGPYPEVERVPGLGFSNFQYVPRNPNYQHYTLQIICRDGQFVENWGVARVDGVLRTRMAILRSDYFLKLNPELDRVVISCADSYVPAHPHFPPPFVSAPDQYVYQYWQSGHTYFQGTVIEGNAPAGVNPPVAAAIGLRSRNLFLTYDGDGQCWSMLHDGRHLGEIELPLTLSSENASQAVMVGCGVLVLLLPLYCLLAFWVMGRPGV